MNKLGNWITNKTNAPFYARKQFEVKGVVKTAAARVCGLGQFHFYINGKKVEDHELDPGWTNYRKLIQYVTFDVTEYLNHGWNMMGAEVGNGWFIKTDEHYTFHFPAFMPPNPNPYQPFASHLVLALELEICYEDGTKEIITADDSFQVKEHPVVMSNVFGSEKIDGRLVEPDWCEIGAEAGESTDSNIESGWKYACIVPENEEPCGEMQNQFQPPVKVIQTYEGKFLHTVESKNHSEKNTRSIYDFGQNMSGILEFEVKGNAGDEVHLYPAEKLSPDGDVDQMAKGWMEIDSCITYVIGKDETWETCRMKFTYFAGRFAAVEGAGVEIRNLKADAISSVSIKNGSFQCDDDRYMKIYDLVDKAVEANMVSVHTDCPTIERFAWQEPNHLMAPSIFYMKDGNKLWEKFLLDMRTEQHTKDDYFYNMEGEKCYPGDGLMPAQAPCYLPNVLPVPGMGSFYDIIAWGSTSILGAYWHYKFYGNQKIIEDSYDAGMRYLEHLKTMVDAEGFISHGLGDWGNPRNDLARENVETAFLYADASILSMFAGILGKEEDKEALTSYAETVKENYNEKLLVQDQNGRWCYKVWDHQDELFMTQASQALPLYWGLVPEDKTEDVVKAFFQTLESEGAFISGEVGLPYVIQTARVYGRNDLIARFILREEHPSYYAFVLDGETTLGEYWESNPRSHCHDMMGHIIEWYYNGIAGIIPAVPGFSKVTIKPYLPETMHEFTCSYYSAAGQIQVDVKETETEIQVKVEVAEGIDAEINLSQLEERNKKVSLKKEKNL